MDDDVVSLDMLIDALKLSAANPADQVQALPEYVWVPDEIANQLNDVYDIYDARTRKYEEFHYEFKKLNDLYGWMTKTNKEKYFSIESLKCDDVWNESRAIAFCALELLEASLRSK